MSACVLVLLDAEARRWRKQSSSERAASVSNSNLKEDSSVIAVGKTTVSYKRNTRPTIIL